MTIVIDRYKILNLHSEVRHLANNLELLANVAEIDTNQAKEILSKHCKDIGHKIWGVGMELGEQQ